MTTTDELLELYELYDHRWKNVAKALGMNPSHLSRVKRHKQKMTEYTRLRISQLLRSKKPESTATATDKEKV